MSIIFKRKRGLRPGAPPFGRLYIGFRMSDWSPVWYEPALSDDEDGKPIKLDDNEQPEEKFFHLDQGEQPREPLETEIIWLPHFDLKNIQAKGFKDKKKLRMRFLYDAWRYCAETDVDRARSLEDRFDRPNDRHWSSWFEEAKNWKKSKMRQRKNNGQKARRTAQDVGITLADDDILEESDDSGYYETEAERMGPPPKPRNRGGKRQRENHGNSPGNKRSRPNLAMMSGGLGFLGSNRAGTVLSASSRGGPINGSMNRYSNDDDDGRRDSVSPEFDDRHPTPVGERSGSQNVNANGNVDQDGAAAAANGVPLPIPRTQDKARLDSQNSAKSPAPGGPLGRGRSQLGLFVSQQSNRDGDEEEDPLDIASFAAGFEQQQQHYDNVNGVGVDEGDALRRAMRASMAPEEGRDRSPRQEKHLPDGVRRSIEAEDDGPVPGEKKREDLDDDEE